MVPQHLQDGNMSCTDVIESPPTGQLMTVKFGSLLVDKNSITPYSDATQVIFFFFLYSQLV